ncbi:MAG: hypothetical protein ACW7DW_18660 [Paraglaciecola chathamensis]
MPNFTELVNGTDGENADSCFYTLLVGELHANANIHQTGTDNTDD